MKDYLEPLSAEEAVYRRIEEPLLATITANGGDTSAIKLDPAKQYFAIKYDGNVFARILSNKKGLFIALPASFLQKSLSPEPLDTVGGFGRFRLAEPDDVSAYIELLRGALEQLLNRADFEWDCCSRYEECSDARKCVHPDKQLALKCRYRKNLESGRIFYGQNPTA